MIGYIDLESLSSFFLSAYLTYIDTPIFMITIIKGMGSVCSKSIEKKQLHFYGSQ